MHYYYYIIMTATIQVMDRRKKSDHADRRYRHSVASVAELQQRMYDVRAIYTVNITNNYNR